MRLFKFGLVCLALVLALGVAAHRLSAPNPPDPFYETNGSPGLPGALLIHDVFTRGVPAKSRAIRFLYATTRHDNSAAIDSALLIVPEDVGSEPLPIVAWAHGTTGIAQGCAPSVMNEPLANVPAVAQALAAGWAIVAPDYVGLATTGEHAYLVGDDAARNLWHATKAARSLPGISLSSNVVVWGHSQGGNTALWAAATHAQHGQGLEVLGAAAMAPASDLNALVAKAQTTMFGKIVSSYVLTAYSRVYADVKIDDYHVSGRQFFSRDMAGRCVGGWGTLFSVAETWLLPSSGIFKRDPNSGALGERLRQNTPLAHNSIPILITQGTADDLVFPEVQDAYVKAACSTPRALRYIRYEGLDHLTLVHQMSRLTPDLITWTTDRFAKKSAVKTCVVEQK